MLLGTAEVGPGLGTQKREHQGEDRQELPVQDSKRENYCPARKVPRHCTSAHLEEAF